MKVEQYIDHTALKPDTTKEQIKALCTEAAEYEFKAVCINQNYITYAKELLKNTKVVICTVVGFPLGASPTEVKSLETQIAIKAGATEIDMVINISDLKNKNYDSIYIDIKTLADTCHESGCILKVIFETCLLTKEEIIKACEISKDAGADFVKTSTGFSSKGATLEDVALMRKTVGPDIGVKASGGVRDLETALKMINAGASRIGTSSGVGILKGQKSESNY